MIVDSLSKNKTLALWPYHFHAALFIVWIRAAMSGHEKNMQQLITKKKMHQHIINQRMSSTKAQEMKINGLLASQDALDVMRVTY